MYYIIIIIIIIIIRHKMRIATIRISPLSEIVLAQTERDSSLYPIIGRAFAYFKTRMLPARGRLYTRYGFTACLLFVHCAFAHGARMARCVSTAGLLRVHSRFIVWTVDGHFNVCSRPPTRHASDACLRSVQQGPASGAVMVRPLSGCGSLTVQSKFASGLFSVHRLLGRE